jgi:nucleoporin NDC1
MPPSLLLTLLTPTVLTTLSYPLTLLTFFLSRSLLLPLLLRLPISSTLLRPVAAHFVFGPRGAGGGAWTVWLLVRHVRLVGRAWFVGVGMVMGWEWAEGVFDSFVRMVSYFIYYYYYLSLFPIINTNSSLSPYPTAPPTQH